MSEVKISRRRLLAFITVTILLAVLVCVAGLWAVDVYYHHKLEPLAGLNVWGYRGPTVGHRKPGEHRVLAIGGSTTFGYGVSWRDAFPAILQELINKQSSRDPVTVINAGYNNEGAHSYLYTLQDYEYLGYDAVVIYTGYNDLQPNMRVYRHESPVFRLTGYMPILPVVIAEKAMMIKGGNDVGALENEYLGRKTTFRPNLAQRATISALETATHVSNSLSQQLSRPVENMQAADSDGAECGPRWQYYCGDMYKAVKYALDHQKRVLVVGQPHIAPDHIAQQQHLAEFFQQKFAGNSRVQLVDLGDALNLKDPALCYDGMHLTGAGNRRIAERLTGPVTAILR